MPTRFAKRSKSSPSSTKRSAAIEKVSERGNVKLKRTGVKLDSSSALYDFLYNIETLNVGCCRLADVGIYKYTIKGTRWTVETDRPEEMVAIRTEDGNLLVVDRKGMRLNGRSIDKICIPGRCYTADDIRRVVVTAIAKLL
jgi:hypothetical protein